MRFCLKKKPSQKWAGEVAQGVDPEFKPGTAKKKSQIWSQILGRKNNKGIKEQF
jgi:hypothetical protein